MSFRELRRNKQQLSLEECSEILSRNTSGVLSVIGDDGYPYGVPLSYTYVDGKLYFHSASEGHKIDAINNCSKVSFCVIDKDQIVPEEFTTYFSSVIVFGKAKVLKDPIAMRQAMMSLISKYSGNVPQEMKDKEMAHCNAAVIELSIEHISGKKARELFK